MRAETGMEEEGVRRRMEETDAGDGEDEEGRRVGTPGRSMYRVGAGEEQVRVMRSGGRMRGWQCEEVRCERDGWSGQADGDVSD